MSPLDVLKEATQDRAWIGEVSALGEAEQKVARRQLDGVTGIVEHRAASGKDRLALVDSQQWSDVGGSWLGVDMGDLGCEAGERTAGLSGLGVAVTGDSPQVRMVAHEGTAAVFDVDQAGASQQSHGLADGVAGFLAQLLGEHIGRYPSREGHVFSSASGPPLRRRNWYARQFRPVVDGRPERPATRGRAYRPKEIQERLGHSTIMLMFDRYGHLFPGLGERLRDGLDRVYQEALHHAASER